MILISRLLISRFQYITINFHDLLSGLEGLKDSLTGIYTELLGGMVRVVQVFICVESEIMYGRQVHSNADKRAL